MACPCVNGCHYLYLKNQNQSGNLISMLVKWPQTRQKDEPMTYQRKPLQTVQHPASLRVWSGCDQPQCPWRGLAEAHGDTAGWVGNTDRQRSLHNTQRIRNIFILLFIAQTSLWSLSQALLISPLGITVFLSEILPSPVRYFQVKLISLCCYSAALWRVAHLQAQGELTVLNNYVMSLCLLWSTTPNQLLCCTCLLSTQAKNSSQGHIPSVLWFLHICLRANIYIMLMHFRHGILKRHDIISWVRNK